MQPKYLRDMSENKHMPVFRHISLDSCTNISKRSERKDH